MKTEKGDGNKKKIAVFEERAALADKKRPCKAVLQSGVHKRNSMFHNLPS